MITFFQKNTSRVIAGIVLLFLLTSQPASTVWANSEEEELFLVAQKAFDDGFYDIAIRYIEQFLQKYPETQKLVQAQLLLGQCYFFKSHYLKAFDIFQSLLKFSEFKDATLFWLGETYFKGADYRQAEKHYQQLITLYSDSIYIPQAYYSLGWTFFEQSKYEKAKKLFSNMVKKFRDHQLTEEAAFKVGECEYNLGEYDAATTYFKTYLLMYPQSTRQAETYFYIAESYYYLEDYLAAVTYYAKAAELAYDPNITFMSKASMGWSYLKLGKFDLSQKYFTEAQKLAEKKNFLADDIYLGLANLYAEMKENEKARDAYANLIEFFPKSSRLAEAYLGKANIDYVLKNYPDALRAYQWIIDHCSEDSDKQEILEKAYYGLAWTYLKSGNIDASIKSFENIMNKTKSKIVKVSALTQIGDAYQDTNQLEKAIEVYDRILKDYPDTMYTDYVQFRQGIALLKLNKFEAATLSFQTLKANFPESKHLGDVEYYLGVAYFKKEDWKKAVNHINRYLDAPERNKTFESEAYYILALSYFNMGNYEKAMHVFESIIKNYPDEKIIVRVSELNIAKSLYRLGQVKEAVKRFTIILQKYPKTETAEDAVLRLGDYYLENSDFESAILYYKQFLNDFPGSDQTNIVYFELGQAYQAQGKLDGALNYYKLIDNTEKELYAKAELAIADIFSKEVDPETAIETYLNITKSSPDFRRDAFVKIAGIHKQHKQYTEAIETYQEALNSDKKLSDFISAELQFYIGDTYELLNESDKAVDAYLKIPYLYAKETSWVIKSYLRIARIFEDSEKWEEAQTIYKKVADYNTEESKYALERLNWIKENSLVE